MHGNLSNAANDANSAVAQSDRETGTIVPEKIWFALLVKNLWPIKAAIAIEQYARVPDRTARAYQSGDREPPASVLRDLLLGNEGYRVLNELPANGPVPGWLIEIRHALATKQAIDGVRK